MLTPTKEVFISYAEGDKPIAIRLRDVIQELFGVTTWVHEYDLNGGDLVFDAIDTAIADAKWWIILISKEGLSCSWIKNEARIGTFKSLENENFKVILIKIEDCGYPKELDVISRSQYSIDLSIEANREDGFMQIASYIDKFDKTRTNLKVYEDRGKDKDNFSLITRRNKIAFVLGWRGIGKSAFVENSVGELLGKRSLKVPLTYNHSLDRLARDILNTTHRQQLIGDLLEKDLLDQAIKALIDLSENFFLFLDDAESGLDGSNRLLPYLDIFLKEFSKSNVKTHVIISTTRNPDYSEELSKEIDVFRLGIIEDIFMEEIIYKWLEGSGKDILLRNQSSDREKIIRVVGGHALAAKRMSSYLKLKSISQLVEATRAERFQLGFADYILRATQDVLSEIHLLILEALAAIQEPVEQAELSEISIIKDKYTVEEIYTALWELTDWFLIEQKGEKVFLHGFLQTYYSLQLAKDKDLRDKIAENYGVYAYNKTVELEKELEKATAASRSPELLIKLSNELYRYALPADRLLRVVGKDELANKIPIRNQGTLRGMAYYFYQEAGDYPKALEYAEKWLELNPNDWDITLYQIRSYRKIGGKANLEKAWKLLKELSNGNHKKQFQIRLVREKALLSIMEGDVDAAEGFYRKAIQMDEPSYQPYSEIYAGLARLLIRKADDQPEWEPQHQVFAKEALDLLEIAKKEADNFYRFHLDAYAEALVQLNQYEVAYPLLLESLKFRPDDGKLNFRMAELQRGNRHFQDAKEYADKSIKNGYNPSFLTYANILYDEAMDRNGKISNSEYRGLLNLALEKTRLFLKLEDSPIREKEVAHTIRAKIFRTLGEYDKATEELYVYKNSNNPYTVYEQANLCLLKGNSSNNLPDALNKIQEGIDIIQAYKFKFSHPLETLLETLYERQKQIKRNLGLTE